MSRHNRNGTGVDQLGFRYRISYPPDWLERVRVTRRLSSGRQSTKTLFRNPRKGPEAAQGALIRVAIESPDQNLAVKATVSADPGRVGEIVLRWRDRQASDPRAGEVAFTLRAFPRPARGPGGNRWMHYLS